MTEKEFYDAGNPDHVAAQTEEARQATLIYEADFKALMATLPGRRLMWALLDRCGVFRCSFTASRPDPLVTAFAEGERNIGLEQLLRIHRLCPDHYLAMLNERLQRNSAERVE